MTVTGPATQMTTQLELGELGSEPSTRLVTPAQPIFVGVRVPGATLRVLFNEPGRYTVCSATPPPAQ